MNNLNRTGIAGEFRPHVHVIGAGAWGTTLALLAHRAGNIVSLASHNVETVQHLQLLRQHPRSLPGVILPLGIEIVHVDNLSIGSDDIVIWTIPVQRTRSASTGVAKAIGSAVVVSVAKGIEIGTLNTPVAILRQTLTQVDISRFAAMSGPNLAAEIAAGQPATTVVASESSATAWRVQHALTTAAFRVYTSSDVIGVELGGALKNIIAIGAGIADGLGIGDNAKAAFMTRGIAEIARLGVARGALPMTFSGLSGIGDLIATCSSSKSRNHAVGRGLAEGRSLEAILGGLIETAEGIDTTRAAYALAEQLGVDAPIIRGMYGVLFKGVSPIQAIANLMNREPTEE